MASIYEPFDPRRRMAAQGRMPTRGNQRLPTMEDYQELAQAYREQQVQQKRAQQTIQELQSQLEQQSSRVSELDEKIQVKDDALRAQGEDLQKAEAELVWTMAGLQQARSESQESESQQWQNKYLGLQTEVENLRKRWETRSQTEVRTERNRILLDMLPLADHLDLALQHANTLTDPAFQTFMGNIEVTRQAFAETLRRYDVERIEALGHPFDPNLHDALGQMESKEIAAGNVAQVVETGYMDGDRVLRPAKVMVSRGPNIDVGKSE